MGSLFDGPPHPASPPMPPPAANPSTLGSTSVGAAGATTKAAAGASEGIGQDGTIVTSPEGLQEKANTSRATLLGQ